MLSAATWQADIFSALEAAAPYGVTLQVVPDDGASLNAAAPEDGQIRIAAVDQAFLGGAPAFQLPGGGYLVAEVPATFGTGLGLIGPNGPLSPTPVTPPASGSPTTGLPLILPFQPAYGNLYPLGPTAPTGPTGPVSGPTSISGPTSYSGPSGPTAMTGPSGPSMFSGPSGPTGITGPSGPTMFSGPSGPTGISGPSGPTSLSGPTGPTGVTGPSMVSGPSGPVVATTMDLSSSAAPAVPGQAVRLTASVFSAGTATPTGNVTFLDGQNVLGSASLSPTGDGTQATLNVTSLSDGSHAITAVYAGDANNTGSSSLVLTQDVGLESTAGSLTSDVEPSGSGQQITLTATFTSDYSGTPTGQVQFWDGDTLVGSADLTAASSGAEAVFSPSALSVGVHNITAVYGGDTTFAGCSSTMLLYFSNDSSNPVPPTEIANTFGDWIRGREDAIGTQVAQMQQVLTDVTSRLADLATLNVPAPAPGTTPSPVAVRLTALQAELTKRLKKLQGTLTINLTNYRGNLSVVNQQLALLTSTEQQTSPNSNSNNWTQRQQQLNQIMNGLESVVPGELTKDTGDGTVLDAAVVGFQVQYNKAFPHP